MNKTLLLTIFAFLIHSTVFSQWVKANGPVGAYTNHIVRSGSYIILNAGNGGIFRSLDNGALWEWSGWGLPCDQQVIALSEYNNTLYASIYNNGIYISTNNGGSWNPINTGVEDKTFNSLFVDRINLYVGDSEGGMYYSDNNGTTWSDRRAGVEDVTFTSFVLFNSKLYAGGKSSVNPSRHLFESSDNGVTWKQANVPDIGFNGIRSMVVHNGILYVADDDTVFMSSDGVTWNPTTVHTNASIVSIGVTGNSVYLTSSQGRYYISPNNGVTWNLMQNTSTNAFANHLFFSNGKIIMSTDQGLFQSFDSGATWQANNAGITGSQILSFGRNGSYLFVGTDIQGVFRYSLDEENWEPINTGINTYNSLHVSSITTVNENIYLGTGDGVYKSTNNGNSWEHIFNPGVSTYALSYDNDVLVTAASGQGIYISQDFGSTWTLTSTVGITTDTSYKSITISGNTIVVGTANGEVFTSQDLGASWINRSIPGGYNVISELQISNNQIYAATSNGLYVTNNLGVNWSQFNPDVKFINGIDIDGDKIYAATNSGIYVANQSSKIWYPLCDGIGIRIVNEVFISDSILFAGTFASSVWRRLKIIGSLPPTEDENTIGIDNLAICPNETEVNLWSYVGVSPNARGYWSPSLSKNGFFTPGLDAEGTYKFVYQEDLCGCEAYIKVNISLNGLFAGNDASLTLCSMSEPVNLFERLGPNAVEGGLWAPALASGTGVFNPQLDKEGTYTYTVINDGCPSDTAEVTVIVSDNIDVGIGGEFPICYSQTPFNLFSLLGGTPDEGGEWFPKLSGSAGLFNPAVERAGTYAYYFPNSECSQDRAEIHITLVANPNPGISNASIQVCINSESVDLFDALGATVSRGGSWSPELASGTSFFNPKMDVPGRYAYTVGNICGIEVSYIEVSTYESVNTNDYSIKVESSENQGNTVILDVDSSLPYEFSLDGVSFQREPIFYNVPGGLYTVKGREIAGCNSFEELIMVIGHPNFFTPNGDGINDTWSIEGEINQDYNLYIYDRYGNMLKSLKPGQGWDGTFRGKPLPSTDYWFKLVLEDGSSKVGHFALKR